MKAKTSSLASAFLAALIHASLSSLAADFAWRDTNTYRPPSFDSHFTHDAQVGKRLAQVMLDLRRQIPPPENVFEIFRRGLTTCPDYPQTTLGWLGNEYIWNKKPQNAEAIELVYHAIASTNQQISYNALYFGLSTVRPMTEPILHALVDLAITSDDPNVLSRIAWGASAHKDRLQFYLQPHLASTNPAVRAHAQTLEQIFSGKLKAFAWATEQARKNAQTKYSARLEEFRSTLVKGDSKARRELIELILDERIALIMDDSFIAAFAAAASDPDHNVRERVAMIVGGRWIWDASDQAPEAIELMMRLSRDDSRDVRYDANYYGLSVIRHRTDEEVERMLEMALHDGMDNPNFLHRITWGLERDRELVRYVTDKWMTAHKTDLIKAAYAYGFHLGFLKKDPEIDPGFQKILDEPDKPVARVLVFLPKPGWKPESIEEYTALLRQELPAELASQVPWNNDDGLPFVIVEERHAPAFEKALANSSKFRIEPAGKVTVQNLIDVGKGTRFSNLKH